MHYFARDLHDRRITSSPNNNMPYSMIGKINSRSATDPKRPFWKPLIIDSPEFDLAKNKVECLEPSNVLDRC